MAIPIITQFNDDDLYKMSMAQVVWKHFPHVEVEYSYKCRSDVNLDVLADRVQSQVNELGKLGMTDSEEAYLKLTPYLPGAFISAIKRLRLNPAHVTITTAPFAIKIKGPWLETIFWEIFLLAVISHLHYARMLHETGEFPVDAMQKADEKLTEKIEMLKEFQSRSKLQFRLIEFGTRRRHSADWQDHVLGRLVKEVPNMVFGTSNMKLAAKYNIRKVGTMAHEYLQAFQALVRLRDSQKTALQMWADVYRGDLGIALTDVISMDAFLEDFDLYFAKLFDGLRHDSGCPYVWANKGIKHYDKLHIDPRTKALVFSDGLDIPKSIALCEEFEPYIKTSFGIGTNLSCDIPGVPALNHVIKMTHCQGQPVAKLSDSPGKSMCEDAGYLTYLKQVFDYKH